MTVRTFVDDPGAVQDIREGEVVGSVISLIIALAATKITGSHYPLMVAALMIGLMVGVYEYALRYRRGSYSMLGGTASEPASK
jgi:hypothetical protein